MTEYTMFEYEEFVDNLKIELKSYKSTPKELWRETAYRFVNGFAAEEVRRLISLKKRRNDGVFFTDSLLAEKVLDMLQPSFNKQSVVYDAACGAGNLLIAASNYLNKVRIQPISKNYLLGTDIHSEFVGAANLRLQMNNLLLLSKKTNDIAKQKNGYLIKIKTGLISNQFYKNATHIFLNPPFDQEKPDEKIGWAAGKVSMAAVFMEKAILFANPGTTIMAILPDVLRSGTRYEKWRNLVNKHCITERIELLGQFDKHADVDVYAIKLVKRQEFTKTSIGQGAKKTIQSNKSKRIRKPKVLKDLFDIRVGPVVDFRDEKIGNELPYIVSRGLESWAIQTEIPLTRKHQGKSFEGPFVVIKRTSRATDKNRAVATIINTAGAVYVDNHLVMLMPKTKTVASCQLAIRILKNKKTNDWLNQEIRCRHLTVKAVMNIPLI